MKYLKPTYYLLAILCLISASCSNIMTDEVGMKEDAEAVKVRLTLAFPTSTRGVTGGTNEGADYERYINDIRIFTFVDNKFVEEAQNIVTEPDDGRVNRVIYASLLESYDKTKAITVVTLVNSRARGVNISINQNDTKEKLYSQLTFEYKNPEEEWSFIGNHQYIPMWGESTITNLTAGEYNIGELKLTRAIAKVSVTVRDGNGIKGFQIKNIRVCHYNTQGYCAPTDGNVNVTSPLPSIPSGTKQATEAIAFNNLSTQVCNKFEDRIYIPEQNNQQADAEQRIYLEIDATIEQESRTYTIEFKEKDKYYDVLRNYSYVFNILKATYDVELVYEVKEWENINIDVPGFGNKE